MSADTTTATAQQVAEPVADAILRLIGLDSIVDDHEFDAEIGHKYFLLDGNVITVAPGLVVTLTDSTGDWTVAHYGSTTEIADYGFKLINDGQVVELYQMGQFIAAEDVTA